MVLMFFTTVDEAIGRTRQFILEKAGHVVVSAMDEHTLIAACRQHVFQVAVIAQDVRPARKRQALALVRQHSPSAKVLELYKLSKVLDTADSWLEAPVDAQVLADRVSALTAMAAKQSS